MTGSGQTSPYHQGDRIPRLQVAPITRSTLALFAGASHDHNPMHIDIDAARAAGRDDVFAHGMLSMAYLGRVLTNAFGPAALRKFDVRFTAITHVHDRLECIGEVVAIADCESGQRVDLHLCVLNSCGEAVLLGEATVELRRSEKA